MALGFGFLLVLIAGFFQGTFVLPMTLTKEWKWEHTWATFSLFGMLIFNWILTFIIFPDITSIFIAVPTNDIIILLLFGAGWGIGAVLFGLGMDKLGMALGYPIIMGLIASLGALIPLVLLFPETLFQLKGVVLLVGMAITIIGIIVCSKAGAANQQSESTKDLGSKTFAAGLIIAVFAGILSSLPNVGMAFGTKMVAAAKAAGTSELFASNIIWSLFFTVGFVVNFGYCLFLMLKNKNTAEYFNSETTRNLSFGGLMAVLWIGSFYLYGMSSVKLGQLGVVVGWPVFISLSIIVGNIWGLWRGEWDNAPERAKKLLYGGIAILIISVVVIAMSNSL